MQDFFHQPYFIGKQHVLIPWDSAGHLKRRLENGFVRSCLGVAISSQEGFYEKKICVLECFQSSGYRKRSERRLKMPEDGQSLTVPQCFFYADTLIPCLDWGLKNNSCLTPNKGLLKLCPSSTLRSWGLRL